MNSVRQIGTILLIPAYIIIGAYISEEISRSLGVWFFYVCAIVTPTIGLVCTAFIAPYYKTYNISFVYVAGITLAYILGYPAQYPEGHEFSYQWTYRPFTLTMVWSSALFITLIAYEKYRKKP